MQKSGAKIKRIQLNKVCRSCLSERGHLREIFSTKIPMLMEYCANVNVSEEDGLPKHICVSCFHQIAKFYNFKRKMEKSDRILRNYLKQNKSKQFSDILHRAVNDAEIELMSEDLNSNSVDNVKAYESSDSEDDIPLSQRKTYKNPKRFKDLIFEKDNKIENSNAKSKEWESKSDLDNTTENAAERRGSDQNDVDREVRNEQNSNIDVIQLTKMDKIPSATILPQILLDEPPPLVPLIPKQLVIKESSSSTNCSLTNLPENTPPLVPLKPLPTKDPPSAVEVSPKSIEDTSIEMSCTESQDHIYEATALKEHKLANCQMMLMQCNICKKEFKERKRLIGHLRGHMVVKDYGCKICGKCYPNPSTFRVHMRTHTGERPFKCHICNKGFVRYAGVVGHLKTHNSNKPYKCETCGKGFKISSNLERHKVLHTGILPYCCNFCGKTFSQSENLQLHIRTYHTHEKPYLCNVCGKGFVSSTRLTRHMWVHTGYKPYTCSTCPKAYSNANDLKIHERLHSGNVSDVDKRYACPICNMRFFHQCRLTKHMKTHDRAFMCAVCNKGFSTDELYNKHMVNKHSGNFSEPVVAEVYFSIE